MIITAAARLPLETKDTIDKEAVRLKITAKQLIRELLFEIANTYSTDNPYPYSKIKKGLTNVMFAVYLEFDKPSMNCALILKTAANNLNVTISKLITSLLVSHFTPHLCAED